MARIAGIQIEKDVKGRPAYARINLKKHPETLELLAKIGAIDGDDFDAEFAKGISGEELIKRVCSDLEKILPKKNG
jgi:hypothetical protein